MEFLNTCPVFFYVKKLSPKKRFFSTIQPLEVKTRHSILKQNSNLKNQFKSTISLKQKVNDVKFSKLDPTSAPKSFKPKFLFGAKSKDSFPPQNGPEVAIIGRSNVGKSTLINSLCQHTSLARVSDKPGLTSQINFYAVGSKKGFFVDMPGYGFAFKKPEVLESWKTLTGLYFSIRSNLRRVIVLIDGRVGIKESDKEIMGLLESQKRKFQVVVTKVDLIKVPRVVENIEKIKLCMQNYKFGVKDVMLVSSRTGGGVDKLRNYLFFLLESSPYWKKQKH